MLLLIRKMLRKMAQSIENKRIANYRKGIHKELTLSLVKCKSLNVGGDRMKSIEETIDSNLELIETMVEDNKTDKEIAAKLGIGYSTFKRYKATNTGMKEAIAEGKDKKNQAVEQALYKCCIGYHYYEDVATKVKVQRVENDQVLESEEVNINSVKKYRGPELSAQKYWLNNKQKSKWSEDPNKASNDKKLTKLKEKEVDLKFSPVE